MINTNTKQDNDEHIFKTNDKYIIAMKDMPLINVIGGLITLVSGFLVSHKNIPGIDIDTFTKLTKQSMEYMEEKKK